MGEGAMTSGHAPVNGLQIYYEIHGTPHPGRPPLILLHGGGSSIDTSFGEVLAIYARTRQVVAFDQQGHGRTADIADRPFSFEQSADDTAALLGHLGIGQADFLGYSNGGHIVIEIALKYPAIVRRIIIQSAMIDRSGTAPQFWEGFAHATVDHMPPELRESYLRVAPEPDFPSFFIKGVRRMMAFSGWTPEQIRSITAPTLVVAGDRDVVTPEHAVQMYRLLPQAQLAILPNLDHAAIVGSTVVPQLVAAFLD
jgi:pimeloyl-ACP methyl ester carboxylesterase